MPPTMGGMTGTMRGPISTAMGEIEMSSCQYQIQLSKHKISTGGLNLADFGDCTQVKGSHCITVQFFARDQVGTIFVWKDHVSLTLSIPFWVGSKFVASAQDGLVHIELAMQLHRADPQAIYPFPKVPSHLM